MKDGHNLMGEVENSQNEVGRTIRRLRKARKLSAEALAKQGGLKKSALLHYENGIRSVSEEALSQISTALGVPSSTLRARHIESVADAMQVLFLLERVFGLKPGNNAERFSFSVSSDELAACFSEWKAQYEKLISGELTEEEYQDWKDRFPLQYNNAVPAPISSPHAKDTESAEYEALASKDPRFKRDGILRLKSHAIRAFTGMNGSYVPIELQQRICRYVNCSEQFLNDESCVKYQPLEKRSQETTLDNQVFNDILVIMDYNADTEHFRTIQVQLSRIVLSNLKAKGFSRKALQLKCLMAEQMEYLYTGKKAKSHSVYVGLDLSQLGALYKATGISFREMFTGIQGE